MFALRCRATASDPSRFQGGPAPLRDNARLVLHGTQRISKI